jgi:CRP-like cAMP-binding protein
VATVRLLVRLSDEPADAGPLKRLVRAFVGGRAPRASTRPKTIAIDGPTEIDANTLDAPLNEGDVFGEMSCLTGSPRSGTITADRDCYMLEMLRVVLDQMRRDAGYREQMEAIYRERVLAGHLRRLSIFEHVPDEAFQRICQTVELLNFEPGQVICDEHAPSDSIYIIRSGIVKVVKNISVLFGPEELSAADCATFCQTLLAGEQASDTPAGKIWSLLDDGAKAAVQTVASDTAAAIEARHSVVAAINRLLTARELPLAFGKKTADIVAVADDKKLWQTAEPLAADPKKWSDLELRAMNRALLEAVFPRLPSVIVTGPRRTLAYLSRGDFIGEMGLITGEPRNATCIAFDHPDNGQAIASGPGGVAPPRVELVRIGRADFDDLIASSPEMTDRVMEVAVSRLAQTAERLQKPVWEEADSVRLSPRFEELGLIQGQSLMLIDLDRCTRCGDCVRACVNTHSDGRQRLYLDGPRFGRYLVPLTCRECLDPVCMIGCPVGSIHRGDRGEIIIRDWCIGCGLCANQCPYGSIQMHHLLAQDGDDAADEADEESAAEGTVEKQVTQLAVVCDLCSSLAGGQPACVSQCPHDAAIRVDTRSDFPQR